MADIKKPDTVNGVSPEERGTAETIELIKNKPIPSGHDSLGGAWVLHILRS